MELRHKCTVKDGEGLREVEVRDQSIPDLAHTTTTWKWTQTWKVGNLHAGALRFYYGLTRAQMKAREMFKAK